MEARNATSDKIQAKIEVEQMKLKCEELQSEIRMKDDTLWIMTEDYTGKIKELTKKNEDILWTKMKFKKIVAELMNEKNALEAKLAKGKDLGKKLIPVLFYT
ncbi:hypothetical protein R1flu_005359 [Riccia fluitans]|uniref:Uncharacterized protein n=1 Tax=Riccia fluitans TaxID=41844 RepID=A0ABD1YTR5_9MARC